MDGKHDDRTPDKIRHLAAEAPPLTEAQREQSATPERSSRPTLVPPAEIDRVFQPFQRLGTERTRRTGGHGLGLAIVQAIATAHGATLAARARPEGGLEIKVRFPATTAQDDDGSIPGGAR